MPVDESRFGTPEYVGDEDLGRDQEGLQGSHLRIQINHHIHDSCRVRAMYMDQKPVKGHEFGDLYQIFRNPSKHMDPDRPRRLMEELAGKRRKRPQAFYADLP